MWIETQVLDSNWRFINPGLLISSSLSPSQKIKLVGKIISYSLSSTTMGFLSFQVCAKGSGLI